MAELFRGYIESKGKRPLGKIKNATYLTEPPTNHDYVGVLKDDIIQLDFDDERSARIVMNIVKEYKLRCDVLQTTRGVHLYFKRDTHTKSQSVGIFNAIGLKCDVGLGDKNRVIPLRTTKQVETTKIVDGEEVTVKESVTTDRPWLQTYAELEECPAFLRPISHQDFKLASEGARNQTLFNYILKLQIFNMNRDEIRKTIKVINRHILHEPLPDKEIDTITRDEAFSEELFFSDRGRFLHDRFGDYMLTNAHIMRIDGQVVIYTRDHLYSNQRADFEKRMLEKIPSLTTTQRNEVFNYVQLRCTRRGQYASPKYLGLKDCILDLETMETFDYSPQWVINNRIEVAYNPDAYSEVLDRTLNKVAVQDAQIRALMEEMVGYTMYRANSMQVAFILTGEGSNGKSTILNVIKKFIGKQNYSSLSLQDMESTFAPAQMHNMLANLGDDIPSKYLENSSIFKKVVTGESFVVQRKYEQPFELESYATQIFCANELPQVHDKSDGFMRRLRIIPFDAKFTKKDPDYDPFIEEKLLSEESLQYLLNLAIEGLRRVIINKKFTVSDKGEAEQKEYQKFNNNVLEWLDEEPPIENNAVADVYMAYQVWCSKNGCQPVKKMNFSKEIKKQTDFESKIKSINGKSVRVYIR